MRLIPFHRRPADSLHTRAAVRALLTALVAVTVARWLDRAGGWAVDRLLELSQRQRVHAEVLYDLAVARTR